MAAVNMYADAYRDYPIVFIGHSLGGAIATLGAVLEDWGRDITLVNFHGICRIA